MSGDNEQQLKEEPSFAELAAPVEEPLVEIPPEPLVEIPSEPIVEVSPEPLINPDEIITDVEPIVEFPSDPVIEPAEPLETVEFTPEIKPWDKLQSALPETPNRSCLDQETFDNIVGKLGAERDNLMSALDKATAEGGETGELERSFEIVGQAMGLVEKHGPKAFLCED